MAGPQSRSRRRAGGALKGPASGREATRGFTDVVDERPRKDGTEVKGIDDGSTQKRTVARCARCVV